MPASSFSPLLGCAGEYRVEVYLLQRVDDQDVPLPAPEMRYVGVLEGITGITWERRLRAASQADITIDLTNATADCCRMFQIIADSVRVAQLRIWRDDIQVWEGEVMQASEVTGSTVKTIMARDMIERLNDTVNNLTLNYVDTPITEIAFDIIERNLTNATFSNPLDDSMILSQIVVEAVTDPDDTISYRPGAKIATVGEILRILGQSYGLDFTAINRSIRLQRRRTTQDQTYARLNTEHLIGEAEARSNGLAAATRGWATTQTEDARQPKTGEVDPNWPGITANFGVTGTRYGRIDVLNRVQDNQADADDVLSSAKRAVWGRNPPPSEILLPTTAQLSPSAPLTMPELVPGMRIDFFAEDGLCRPIRQGMRLLALEVTWTPAGANTNQGEDVALELSTLSDVTGVEP